MLIYKNPFLTSIMESKAVFFFVAHMFDPENVFIGCFLF